MIIAQPGFLPARLPDLFQWCSFRRSNITLNLGNISQIDDLSGNNNHWIQASAGNQPSYSNTIDGATVATFDGVSSKMASSLVFPKGNYSVFFVIKTLDLRGALIARDDTGYGNIDTLFGFGQQNVFPSSNGKVTFERHAPSPNRYDGVSSASTYNDGSPHFVGFVVNGFNEYVYADDSIAVTTGTIDGCFKGLTVNLGVGNNASSTYYAGDIAETIIYDRAISATEIGYIKNYMKMMWSIP